MFAQLPAVERIEFQTNSNLRKRLVALCSEYLTWVLHTRAELTINGVVPPATEGRLLTAAKYGSTTFAPQLMRLLNKELNLNVLVMCDESRILNCMMMPAFLTADWQQVNLGESFFSGTAAYGKTEFDPSLFDSLDSKIDLNKSSFVTNPKQYLAIFYIFAATYLGEEVFGGTAVWTAEEHAAVILHELGHALSMFEHMADMYYRADVACNSIRYLNQQADDKTLITTISKLDTAVRGHHDESWAKQFDEALTTIKKNDAATKKDEPGMVVASLILSYFCSVIGTMFARLGESGSFGKINADIHKSSDTVVTLSNAGYSERIADEFVSRHGLSAALASALKKMNTYGYTRTALADAIHNHVVSKIIVGTFNGILYAMFGMLLYVEEGTCDPLWLRIEHILRNNMVVFKDETLSPELRDYFIKDTADLLKTLAAIKNSKGRKIHQLFWGTIMRITSRGSTLDALHTAGLSVQYDILQRLTNGLIKNTLYYYAARIKSL